MNRSAVMVFPSNDYSRLKRGLDIVASLLLLLLLSPLMCVIAMLIWVTSGHPILFRQTRLGKDAKEFTMYKFRSMVLGQWSQVHENMVKNQLQSSQTRRRRQDPFAGPNRRKIIHKPLPKRQFTAIGEFIRRTSMDELPQLWNVLKGEMSLVGPRPPLAYETRHYEPSHYGRFAVLPGLTGLWQVSGRSQLNYLEMLWLDLEYVKTRSVWLDIKILVRTPAAIFQTS